MTSDKGSVPYDRMGGSEAAGRISVSVFDAFTRAYERRPQLRDAVDGLPDGDLTPPEVTAYVSNETILSVLAGILHMLLTDSGTVLLIPDQQRQDKIYLAMVAAENGTQEQREMVADVLAEISDLPTTGEDDER